MVTTVIKSVKPGGGGDYVSLAAWASDRAGNLVTRDTIEVAEVYGGGNAGRCRLNPGTSEWTTDSTHYPWIRAAPGHENNGVFDDTKAYMANTSNEDLFQSRAKFTRFGPGISILLNATVVSGYECLIFHSTNGGIVDGLVVKCTKNYLGTFYLGPVNDGTDPLVIKNTIVINDGTQSCIHSVGNTIANIYNCTLIQKSASGYGINAVSTDTINSNCNYISATNCYSSYVNKGANDATSNTEATTTTLQNVGYSTSNFVNVTAGSENLHLQPFSKLIGNGTSISGVTTDIDGETRGLVPCIGADYAPGGTRNCPGVKASMWEIIRDCYDPVQKALRVVYTDPNEPISGKFDANQAWRHIYVPSLHALRVTEPISGSGTYGSDRDWMQLIKKSIDTTTGKLKVVT